MINNESIPIGLAASQMAVNELQLKVPAIFMNVSGTNRFLDAIFPIFSGCPEMLRPWICPSGDKTIVASVGRVELISTAPGQSVAH